MRKISLRMRITLIVIGLITTVALLSTGLSMLNFGQVASISTWEESYPEHIQINGGFSEPSDVIVENSFNENTHVASTLVAVNQFNETSLFYTILIVAVGGVLTWLLMRRALKPIHQLSQEIAGISENELNIRIKEPATKDELASLAQSFNSMMDRLENAFEEQKSFSTSAAHELKTPLSTIKARIDITTMDNNPSKAEYAQTVTVIKKQTERMIELVNDLFLFSMTNEYKYQDSVVLEDLISNLFSQLEQQAEEKHLVVNQESRTKHTLIGNKPMLERAFLNLLENAIKYNCDGGRININVDESDEAYSIKISNTGSMIPEEEQKNIFQPFYRIDNSRSRKTAGAGLGLAIAEKMIQRHGGSIRVTNQGEGENCFIISLPKLPL